MIKRVLFIVSITLLIITSVRLLYGVNDAFSVEEALEYISTNFNDTTSLEETFKDIQTAMQTISGKNVDGEIEEDLGALEKVWEALKVVYYLIVFVFKMLIITLKDLFVIIRVIMYIIFGIKL